MGEFVVKSKEYSLIATVTRGAKFYVSAVINDLRERMVYDKQYKTESSLIYSANMLKDRINYIAQNNAKRDVMISIELGWARGVYINLDVKLTEVPQSKLYEFLFMTIIYCVIMFDDKRPTSKEEADAIREVMLKTSEYDIGTN